MKQIEITFENRVFDGKYQRFYFLLMDLNDLFGKPFCFVIGGGNTFRKFKVNVSNWKRDSTKYKFAEFIMDRQAKLRK